MSYMREENAHNKIREDTEMKKISSLTCPKCKQETLVDVSAFVFHQSVKENI